jgi:hypothetical protein
MATRAILYKVLHDIMPANQRLHTIGIAQTDTCRQFDGRDTLSHRLLKCADAPEQWAWMKARMDQPWIPDTWVLRPQFKLWPARRHRATLWMIAQFVVFRTQRKSDRTNPEYIDHLQQALRTMYLHKKRLEFVGNSLTILLRTPEQSGR